jgi:hypothetical protein
VFRKLLIVTALVSVLLVGLGVAFAANPPGPGQPGQSCQAKTTSTLPSTQSGSAPGSPFNTNGVSGGVYANPGTLPNGNATNPKAVSQYDVACFQNSQPHP